MKKATTNMNTQQVSGATDRSLMTPAQVQDFLAISPETFYRMVRSRAIPVVRLSSRCLRMRRADVDAYVERMTRKSVGQ
jgi:excisionase family DNA binding protein